MPEGERDLEDRAESDDVENLMDSATAGAAAEDSLDDPSLGQDLEAGSLSLTPPQTGFRTSTPSCRSSQRLRSRPPP